MSVAAQAIARRKAARVKRFKGVSYTERRAYRNSTAGAVFGGAISKTARKSGGGR